MKYTIKELLDNNEIMSHMFLGGSVPYEKLMEIKDKRGDDPDQLFEVEIEMIVDGLSIDPREFFKIFIDQYDSQVEEVARRLLSEKLSGAMSSMANKLNDMEQVVSDWESEINWEVENPLIKK